MTLEEIKLLSELTIMIPTFNRSRDLERVIEYWRETPVTVHILDGSEKPLFAAGALSGSPTITYDHIPKAKDELALINRFKRVVFGLQLPKTQFPAVGADDDFYTICGAVQQMT